MFTNADEKRNAKWQANSGYELANKPKIKKERCMVEEKRENKTTTTNKHFLKRKRWQEMSVSDVTKAGYA